MNIYTKWILLILLKIASSNLLVDKIKSIVASKMSELVMISEDGFPYSNVELKKSGNF